MNSAGVRRRRELKQKEQNGQSIPRRKKKTSSGSSSLRQSLICLLVSGVTFTVFMFMYVDYIPWHLHHRAIDNIVKVFGYYKPVHAVVIDAGSTGSRVLAFTFHQAYLDGHLILDKELFVYTKPGLSSYADNPEAGAATIASLIEKAKDEIPEQYWSKTPLILKATAGLRLLPQEKAEGLLNAVNDLFNRTPFLTDHKSVAIMDGTDEGIFSWGGSTQITFFPTTPSSLAEKQFIHDAVTPVGKLPVYTHSYLGLGLMAARKAMITLNQPNKTEVESECVNTLVKNRKFHYTGVDYYVSGPTDYLTTIVPGDKLTLPEEVPIVDFKQCSYDMERYVKSIAKPPVELPEKKIYAFSYYFDRAAEIGLIDESTGGKVKVVDFKNAAKKVCNEANVDQPFMCLDLTFIWILLEKGFGLRPDTTVFLYKKILGHEISWALGSAYFLLQG
ncbi:adenosine/guanosine diphosphatase [Holotrichia oblita]|uniref:Adenosine/guanosine diphosphatase n=1 Tax=Holotrichia oblita TaxID=644536 RepID=A0ACB9TAT0_HOLOL|nr:adenosine/guanosine diphosphatase [Holotrichia oblita]